MTTSTMLDKPWENGEAARGMVAAPEVKTHNAERSSLRGVDIYCYLLGPSIYDHACTLPHDCNTTTPDV